MTGRLTRRLGAPARLRALLNAGQTIVAPGAFDPLAARLVEEAGFAAVYMTGFGTSAALLGRPDVDLLTMTEMADNAGRIAACVDIPVTADADTGYGNPLNVIRTVGVYEAAGADALFIEALVSEAEIEAAVDAFPDVPLLFNWAEGGKTPPVGLDRLTELGYRIVIFPIATLLAATAAIRRVLAEIATVRAVEQRYAAPE